MDLDIAGIFIGGNSGLPLSLYGMGQMTDARSDEPIDLLSERLLEDEPNRIILFRIQNETVDQFKGLYYFVKHISKVVLEEDQNTALETSSMMEGVLA